MLCVALKRRRKKDICNVLVDFEEARKRNIPPDVHAFELRIQR